MSEIRFVTDIMRSDDPKFTELVPVSEVARYWKAREEFVRRRLRGHGVHLLKIDHPLMVRGSDVEEFEKAHTVILAGRRSDPKRKEIGSTS